MMFLTYKMAIPKPSKGIFSCLMTEEFVRLLKTFHYYVALGQDQRFLLQTVAMVCSAVLDILRVKLGKKCDC